jgi:hypothetical protein
MPIVDRTDPTLPAGGDYPIYPDGKYEVVGIDGWFKSCVDDQNNPFYKPVNNEMRVMLNFKLKDGKQGPPASFSAPQLVALAVGAFGVDAAVLPADRNSSKFLLAIKEAINTANKTTVVEVKKSKGWVKYIPAATPETGMRGIFQLAFKKFYRQDGLEPAAFIKDAYDNHRVEVLYTIVADQNGKPTAWEGYEIREPLYDPFDGYEQTDEGKFPRFKVNENGSRPTAVSRFLKFAEAFTDYDRLINMHSWADAELENPLLAVEKYLVPGRRIVAMLDMTDGGASGNKRIKIDLLKVDIPDSNTTVTRISEPVLNTPASNDTGLKDLMAYINKLAIGTYKLGAAFDEDGTLTVEGATFAKERILDSWNKLGLPDDRKFALLNNEQSTLLLTELKRIYEPPF